MSTAPAELASTFAGRRRGLITVAEALACGMTAKGIRHACGSGRWRRLHRGVLLTYPSDATDLVTELTAARLATRGGIVGGHSAARLWNLDGARATAPELVLPPEDTREQRPGIRLSWRSLDPAEVTVHRGLPATTPARTLLDLARREAPRRVLPLVDNALRRGLLDVDDLAPLSSRARAGRTAFTLADGRAESVFESEVRWSLTMGGVPPEAIQYDVRDAAGRWLARVDFAWPSRRTLLELDGFATHGTPEALQSDLRRQNALVAAGWTVLRFAWADRSRVVPAVRSVLATRAGSR